MPQYTSSATNSGVVVNTVLDTQTNTQTITVTLPTGQVATTTAPGNTQGVPTTVATSIRNQFTAQGVIFSPFAINRGIGSTTANVVNQEALASTTAVVTGNPPPAESAPIPVAAADNPNTTPAPSEPPIENATVPATGQNAAADAAFLEANASEQQVIDPNTDPNTNIGNDLQEQPPQPQQTISLASDPNTNIGAEAQDVTGFEPLTEPPITNDGDEFSGIDEQIQRQKDLEDGSLEFAGIDDQIAANETTLQEPPQLSEEEINQQIQQAGQGSDTEESVFDPTGNGGAPQGLTGPKTNTQSQATQQDTDNFYQTGDWRVRLSLAPSADYLYKAKGNEGILLPLAATNGVLFPYTPSISVSYAAQYDPSDITHSNYKTFQYKSSSVDNFTISCDFTAQDTFEANYLLAVIHFFRSVTKMFYGQDENPKNGTPPPLCYLTGLGAFQFDKHPLAITSFTYSLPTEVDYIRATNTTTTGGVNKSAGNTPINTTDVSSQRLAGLPPGGGSGAVNWQNTNSGSREPTYVPTKMQIQISAVPIVTRNDISRNFSLKDYATGNLLRGSKRKQGGGGIW